MSSKIGNFYIVLLVILLVGACAKSNTRLGRAEDDGGGTVEEGKSGDHENSEDGGSSSDAEPGDIEGDDAEGQTGYAGSAGVWATGTGGISVESGGETAGSSIGGEGVWNDSPSPSQAGETAGKEDLPPPSPDDETGGIYDARPGKEILNPWDCVTDRPFVLGINPNGSSGYVQGWLDSAPDVTFIGELPHFSGDGSDDTHLSLWWSVNTAGEEITAQVYFYGANDATRVAVAEGVERVQDISDASSLNYVEWATPRVVIGTIVVFHYLPTDRYLALRLDNVFPGNSHEAEEPNDFYVLDCSAINASWTFAPVGSADFSRVELPDDNLDNDQS